MAHDDDDEAEGAGLLLDAALSPAPSFTQTQPREPPHCERAVASRTRFHLTLPAAGAAKEPSARADDQHGWSSPHGEPYRPLGRPQLHLKLSPRLPGGVPHNVQRSRAVDSGGAGHRLATGSDKDKELRHPTSCSAVTGGAASSAVAAVHSLFPVAPAGHKRPMDERQVKLARRLHASVGSYSPERVRGLQRRNPPSSPSPDATGEQQPPRGDASLGLLHEAIHECSGRLRAARHGVSFLQQLAPADHRELHALREEYLQARLKTPPAATTGGRASTRVLLDGRRPSASMLQDDEAGRARERLEHDHAGLEQWYLPYTTRELQLSPHQRLPSVRELQLRAKDDKPLVRPLRGSVTGASAAKRASVGRSSILSPTAVASVLHRVGGRDTIAASTPSPCASAGETQPQPQTQTHMPPAHSVEKLQAAVDALANAKREQSERLATALDVLRQDRRECLAAKFRSLRVRGEAQDDLRRMRERSERRRGHRAQAALAETAAWYPELLRKLLARDASVSASGSGSAGGTSLLAAELFLLQAVRRLANAGRELEPTLLFQLVLWLHPEDLPLPAVQQLVRALRDALHVQHEDWDAFVVTHALPHAAEQPPDDRKDAGGQPRDGMAASPLGTRVQAVVAIKRELRRLR